MNQVASAVDHERSLLLQAPYVFRNQEWGLELFAQPLVAIGGNGRIAVGILIPEVARFVARSTDS